MNNKKSPLKDKPLRLPGQSLEEDRFNIVYDKILAPAFLALFFIIFAGMEWIRYFWHITPTPVLYTIISIVAVGYATWRIWRTWPQLRAIRQGIEGEKAVGQYLEGLRENGYQVFHDLIGTGFNVDHVLIGPGGVFTIETKTWSKPVRGEARIQFDGEKIALPGYKPNNKPIIQAKAQAGWLKGLLSESTGKEFHVFPVVVFPGWFIECADNSLRNIWVLEPRGLSKFLQHAQRKLSDEDINLASYHLKRFIRSVERERADKK
jgi:hypothetical protein